MNWHPHLFFNGNCQEAFEFYEQVFGAKIVVMHTHGNSPVAHKSAPEFGNHVLHAKLALGDMTLSGSDQSPDTYQEPRGFSIMIKAAGIAEAERIFKALEAEGVVQIPLHETFWSLSFGMLLDRFGIPWTVNCPNPSYRNAVPASAD
jgi:PhnB protein